ncbi:MAG: glycosyltransferase family 2 protein [Sphingobacteriaceae bacterium]|nr:glycosyltransferase family 2 protein [Cytophagaceae bacterium]
MHLALVILNYNGRKYLETFLPSVLTHSAGAEVVVADNGSTDDSISVLRTHFPSVQVIELGQNYGFAGGYNQALRQISAQFYVLLNSDVEVTPGWLSAPLALLEIHPNVGACQPKLLDYQRRECFEYAGAAGGYLDYLGYPFCRGRLFQSLETDQGQYDDDRPVFWATGACLFVRASAFHAVGGFDGDFFAHMEEVDLCWRLWNSGHEVWYCGASTVYHVGGGTLPKSDSRKAFLNFRNGLALLYKNHPSQGFARLFLLRLLLDGVAGLKFLLHNPAECWAVVRAHFNFYRHLGSWHHKRQQVQTQSSQAAQEHLFPESIVSAYFLRGKRTFSQLHWRGQEKQRIEKRVERIE